MILTSIVITLALVAFVLAMAYRSWQLHGHDEVQDDVEDTRLAQLAVEDAPSYADSDALESGSTLDEEAVDVRDEVALPEPVNAPTSDPATGSATRGGGGA